MASLHRFARLTGVSAGTACAIVTAFAFAAVPLEAQRAIPSTYAITNARIVPVSGPVIEKGTIVIRDGLIAAVGAAVTAPGDARVVDGTGMSVYPGFIDAYSSHGIPGGGGGGGGGGGRGGGGRAGGAPAAPATNVARNSDNVPGLQPELTAVELLTNDADAMAGPQSAGFTAALTAPSSGIFQGQSAFINLAGTDVNAMVLKAPVSQNIGFTPLRSGGFPNSLMGVFAALRQMLLDAQHYRDVQGAYAKNPRGMARPENDPSLEALQPVINRAQPVIMEANTQREIERALDLAKEFNLKVIIAGGSEAYLVADRLKAEGVPVLLSANFPRRTAAPSPDADPDPIRVLKERVEAPKSPARLTQAGVKFAFESGGISNWADISANVQRAIENGLTADQALRALTVQPAEILGLSDRLGTIEVGKIANLTVSRGDLFDRNGRISQLFIDGKPITVRPATASAGDATVSVTGTWVVTVSLEGTDHSVTMSLRQDGNRLTGQLQGALGSAEVNNGNIGTDGAFRFTAAITLKEGTEEATFGGTLEGNALRGRVSIVGHTPGTFNGTRPGRGGGPGGGGRPPLSSGSR